MTTLGSQVRYVDGAGVARVATVTATTEAECGDLAGAPPETVSLFVATPTTTYCLPAVPYSATPAAGCWTPLP